MYLKSIRVKDIYDEEHIIGGEEIIRAYKQVVHDYFVKRFFWIFSDSHDSFSREDVVKCANAATKKITNPIDLEIDSRAKPTDYERKCFNAYKMYKIYE